MEYQLSLAYRPPLPWATLIGYFAARALPGVEEVTGLRYRRTITLPDGVHGAVEVSQEGASALAVRVVTTAEVSPRALDEVKQRAARMFVLGTDAAAADVHLSRDPHLLRLVAANPGLRPPGTWDPYETGVRAIIGQQVSVAGATTIAGRIAARCGEPCDLGDEFDGMDGTTLCTLFPPPEVLAAADLDRIGMPGARVAAVRRLASAVATGEVRLDRTPGEPSLDHLVAAVAGLPGIGPWTANYLALRSGYADAFPATDLGVRRALRDPEGTLPTGRAAAERAERWRPWRAHATVHLWLSRG